MYREAVPINLETADCHTKQTVNIMLATRNIMLEHAELPGKMVLFQDVTKLRELENRLAAQDQIAQLLTSPNSPQILKSSQLDKFVGQSSAMINLLDSIRRLTNSKANVLITGESGTGKELIAKALHYEGDLAEKPFVAVNCGAIPAELIESQLFGHKKGSFTGAISDHKGFFEQANGGTIFLDEIGELPLAMQTKLLRVIQERIIRPIGAEKEIAIDVRIVAATNRDLNKDVSSGAFREDLLYRINVVHLVLPPLRERREDIPLLVKGILNKLVPAGEELPLVSPAALKLLLEHSYPGNIRELENILERAYVFNSQAILPENLKLEVTHNGKHAAETKVMELDQMLLPAELDKVLDEVERRYLEAAYQRTNGSKKAAAELLGINFRSIRYRLDKYGIAKSDQE
jgi:two-component system, NtrC family, response regulator PilR